MTLDDYPLIIAMFRQTPGVSLRDADSKDATARYLERNPRLSFIAECDGQAAGCIMCGHDGRRGYLQHLLVLPVYRNNGIAAALVERCLAGLEAIGIQKSHVDVLKDNESGLQFWAKQGWTLRTDIDRYSFIRAGSANA